MNLIFEHLSIEHTVHIVNDDFPIPSHGMIGNDFAKKHNCILDYGKMIFTVAPKGVQSARVPIQSEILRNVSALPPRSETFKLFRIQSNEFPCVVESQSIAENVWIPTTIIQNKESWITVLNVNAEMQYIQTDKLESKAIENFHILKFNKTDIAQSRSERLNNILKNKIPNHVRDKLMPMCTEFSDIFHLDGKQSTNNFYTQKLALRDNEPVFVKNYRLPQTQKAEIEDQVQITTGVSSKTFRALPNL